MSFEDPHGALNRRGTDPAIEVLIHKVSKMEQSMDKMDDAVTKLAVVEERQTAHHAALERAFGSISSMNDKFDKLIARIEKLETAAPLHNQTQKWVERAIWAAAAAVAMYIAKKTGIVS